jgi:hypothetical protein
LMTLRPSMVKAGNGRSSMNLLLMMAMGLPEALVVARARVGAEASRRPAVERLLHLVFRE